MTYICSIAITTRNRADELRRAIDSCLEQDGSIEIVIMDDGSTDGTQSVLAEYAGRIKTFKSELSKGLIEQRNRLADLCTSEIIVSIDDDAIFSSRDVCIRVVEQMNSDAEIGAVAIPYVDIDPSSSSFPLCRQIDVGAETSQFRGTAYAVRRQSFLRLGGYRGYFIRQEEEGEFCLRMIAAGEKVKIGTCSRIFHYESPRRSIGAIEYYQQRNALLAIFLNAPGRYALAHLAWSMLNGLKHGVRNGTFRFRLRGAISAFPVMVARRAERRPVPQKGYLQFLRLRRASSDARLNVGSMS